MSISPEQIFAAVGLRCGGTVPWGTPPATKKPGVYVVAICSEPTGCESMRRPKFDLGAIDAWIGRVPGLRLDGTVPQSPALAKYLATFWHASETVQYVGKATSLRSRSQQFFRHVIGDASPHKGGHWLKALTNLSDLFIHFVECDDPVHIEIAARTAFQQGVLAACPALRAAPLTAIPFANREHGGHRKQTRLTKEHR